MKLGFSNMDAVVLLGAPGSGKGTQTTRLCSDFGFYRVSTGDIIRNEVLKGTLLGKSVSNLQSTGRLVPDDVVCDMVFSNLSLVSDRNFIFDGFPRTLYQAEKLGEFFTKNSSRTFIFLLDLAFEKILARIINRLSCTKCGAVYNSKEEFVAVGAPCGICGSALVVRQDDNPTVLKERYDIYQKEIMPIVDFFGTEVTVIDGGQSPEFVFSQISKKIQKTIPKVGIS